MPVYIIRDQCGFVKIGVAVDVERRMNDLKTGNVQKLELIAFFKTRNKDYECEAKIHRELNNCSARKGSEWFSMGHKEAQVLCQIIVQYNPKFRRESLRKIRYAVVQPLWKKVLWSFLIKT